MAHHPARSGVGRVLRLTLIGFAGLVVLVVAAGAVFVATFDANSYKPRIIAAVEQATGRTLALNGPIGLKLSLQPTIEARDVAFANPPGFSRPQMVTLERLDLQVALLSLFSKRVEVDRRVLVRPDIRLEIDAQGHPNWQMQAEAAIAPVPAGQQPALAATGHRRRSPSATFASRTAPSNTATARPARARPWRSGNCPPPGEPASPCTSLPTPATTARRWP